MMISFVVSLCEIIYYYLPLLFFLLALQQVGFSALKALFSTGSSVKLIDTVRLLSFEVLLTNFTGILEH